MSPTARFRIKNQSLALTVKSHGWVNLAPFLWNERNSTLTRTIRVFKTPVPLEFRQSGSDILITASTNRIFNRSEKNETRRKIVYILSSDICLAEFVNRTRKYDKDIHRLLNSGGGKFLRGESIYEDTVKTLLTTNASWSFTQLMVKNLISATASKRRKSKRTDLFPTPEEVVQLRIKTLQEKCRLGYRAEYLHNVSNWFISKYSDHMNSLELIDGLRSVKGLGPYSINHISVLLGHYSKLPLDSEVRAFCRESGLSTDREIESYYAKWNPYQFLGYKLRRVSEKCNWIGG